MFNKKNKKDGLDIEKINESVFLVNKMLKILFIVLIIVAVMIVTFVFKEWEVLKFFKILLGVLTPFFIGFIIAWLFNPLVKFLCKHKFNRVCATILVYIVFIVVLGLFVVYSVPTITSELNEFVNILPKLTETFNNVIDKGCEFLTPILNEDAQNIRNDLYNSVVNVAKDITVGLPDKVIGIVSTIFSGLGTLVMGLFIGFYMLLDFDNVSKVLINFLPANWRKDARNLIDVSNKTLVNYIQGILLTMTLVWIGNSIGFSLAGLEASLLFAFFCGITNVIPYVGPYVGGIPAAIVGFSQSVPTGIFVIVSLVVVQLLDNVIFTPLVQSKGLKLHPVTIIIVLLVFGHFFGIIGMIFAVPITATLKTIFKYFNDKYEFIKLNEEIEEEVKEKTKEKK